MAQSAIVGDVGSGHGADALFGHYGAEQAGLSTGRCLDSPNVCAEFGAIRPSRIHSRRQQRRLHSSPLDPSPCSRLCVGLALFVLGLLAWWLVFALVGLEWDAFVAGALACPSGARLAGRDGVGAYLATTVGGCERHGNTLFCSIGAAIGCLVRRVSDQQWGHAAQRGAAGLFCRAAYSHPARWARFVIVNRSGNFVAACQQYRTIEAGRGCVRNGRSSSAPVFFV